LSNNNNIEVIQEIDEEDGAEGGEKKVKAENNSMN